MPAAREEPTKPVPHQRERPSAKQERKENATENDKKQLIFTIDGSTGSVLRIEMIDQQGKRHEVPRDQTVTLAGKDNLEEIEAALDEAFEAGISSLLGPAGDDQPGEESDEEEKELRRLLLMQLVGRKVRRRLQRRLVHQFILSRTLAH